MNKSTCLPLSLVIGVILFYPPCTNRALGQTTSGAAVAATGPRSTVDLEKLLAPIALYPDPLVATILPASVYPLEIVEAARFVKDSNNLAMLDQRPWDENVKAVARIPEVINKMNEDIAWTSDLGQAFVDQQKEVMDTIQSLRAKAQSAGTLTTTPQQIIVVTNTIIEKTIEQQVVVVTNTVVQIQPSNPEVVYVPTYDPVYVYAPPPGPPPIVTFAAGVAVGAIIANNCDWHGGGVYVGPRGVAVWGGGGYHGDVDINVNRNVNINNNFKANRNVNTSAQIQKWQPDQNRMKSSGAPVTARSPASRGWSGPAAAPASTAAPAARSVSPQAADRPAVSAPAGNSGARTGATSSSHSPDSAFSGVSAGSNDRSSSQRGNASRHSSGGSLRSGGTRGR